MVSVVCVGAQWGDEGKGKVVHTVSKEADLVVRFRAGKKTGHTVVLEGNRYLLHALPAGVLNSDAKLVISNDTYVDPEALIQEVELLELRLNIDLSDRLHVSEHAVAILDYHKRIEKARRDAASNGLFASDGDSFRLAEDDISHAHGIRLGDYLTNVDASQMVRAGILYANSILDAIGAELYKGSEIETVLARMTIHREKLARFITNTSSIVRAATNESKNIVFEGARGSLKDSHFGSCLQPLSLNLSPQAAARNAVPLKSMNHVLLVSKGYSTRFGKSHFPSEMQDAFADKIRMNGDSSENSSQRELRCGWLDIPALIEAKHANGATHLALTKLDLLATLPKLKLGVSYKKEMRDGNYVCNLEEFEAISDKVEFQKGFSGLSEEMIKYLKRIEELVGLPIVYLSFGEEQAKTIYRSLFSVE